VILNEVIIGRGPFVTEAPAAVMHNAMHAEPGLLAAAEKRLAQHAKPLARVLIKRAASNSGNVKELYRKLAEHIDSEPERKAFLDGLR
jgi:hypothetical protein